MSHYISQAQGISSDESGTLRLTYEGRRKAEQYIDDVFNPDLVDSWPSNSDTRSTNARTKRQGKKSGEHHNINDTEVSEWMQHAVSKDLISAIDHSTIVALSLVDKALLALYGIYMSGNEQEIALSLITKYLYSAFDVQVKASSLSKALYKVREEKTGKSSYVNFREGSGYKITPSGRKYMEEMLQLQQKQLLAANENNASNGVK